ncbi:MAG: hypothetical protein PWR20_1944 [Bacteroidales bacterium]|jgi:hypothetical protein|nr:hypothetical protein [Bacteroidales bacterium]MDN5329992.1 hypothetical protein [Bacteroidales bacterium]
MNIKHIISAFLLVNLLVWVGCKPSESDKPQLDPAPSADQLNFTVQPGEDDFHFVFKNTSTVKGIAKWDLGNGVSANGDEVVAYYPLPGTYVIKLTLYTNGGSAFITREHTTTKTDYSYFSDPLILALSGGPEAINGKTWMIDSVTPGHFGVGPSDSYNPVWWSAGPLEKSPDKIYDDEWTFKLNEFKLEINTKGRTLCSNGAVDRGLSQGYYVERIWNNDYDSWVTTNDAKRGNTTWLVDKKDEKYFIRTSPDGAILGFDRGGSNDYEVLEFNENYLYLRVVNGGEAFYNRFIAKGYVPPTISFNLNVNATGNPNEFSFSLSDINVPAGQSISNLKYDFGDGASYETANTSEVVKHTYMRKGTYYFTLEASTSLGMIMKSSSITVEQNHPNYEPYLLDAMVMYNDFGETQLVPLQIDKSDGDGSVEVVDNPNPNLYPNRSAHVAKFTKINAQWANAYLLLPTGYRFNLTLQPVFKVLVYGKAGDQVLLKLENTDYGGNAWQVGTHDLIYTIQKDNTWEIATFDLHGVGAGWDWTGQIFTDDVTTDPRFNDNFYNVVRIMINPGNNGGTFTVWLDDLAGPHVEGLKK